MNVLRFLVLAFGILLGNIQLFALDESPEMIQIENKYSIDLVVDSFTGGEYALRWSSWSTPDNSDSAEFAEFIKIFAEEWNKYPAQWIEVNKLKKIVFVKNLRVTHQYRFAMPDPYDETLYYDIEYGFAGEEYIREEIHHEFWHMIEEEAFGTMYYRCIQWQHLNHKGFKYGSGGSEAYDDDKYTDKEHPRKGFVDSYCTYGEEEDRAETYCWLFTPRTWLLLTAWTQEDKILNGKVNWMLSFIESKVPEMNRSFFEKLNE